MGGLCLTQCLCPVDGNVVARPYVPGAVGVAGPQTTTTHHQEHCQDQLIQGREGNTCVLHFRHV